MSNLKELTWEHHKDAERQAFVKVLLSGKINPKFYATFLWNQHKKYDLLEALANTHGLLDGMPDIKRKMRIEEDFLELWTNEDSPPVILNATNEYIMHMKDVMHDPDSIMAHVYTYHMGDLSGGQMIKRKVPGQGRMYEFDTDVPLKEIKDTIRDKTNDGMVDEAQFAFMSATKVFQEMMELDIEHYMEETD
tara:strand:- start:222 stop:797 length:576 start_codon:yes stop_codon:yes gene_type:complete